MNWEVMVKEKGPAIKELKGAQTCRETWGDPEVSKESREKGGPR